EEGERAETAAIREVLEETGGVVKTLEYIAQYNVTGKKDTIIKNVYFAHIGQLTDIYKEYETLGPLFIKNLPTNLNKQNNYSFMIYKKQTEKRESSILCLISNINRTEKRESSILCLVSSVNRTEKRESSILCLISTVNRTEKRESSILCLISSVNRTEKWENSISCLVYT